MDIPREIINKIKWSTYPKKIYINGQFTGNIITRVTLEIEDSFKVSVNTYRNMIKNRELCLTMLRLYLIEIEII